MSKLLARSGHAAQTTTTPQMARRMLASLRILANHLPQGLAGTPAVDILLALYVAEDDALYGGLTDLHVPTSFSHEVTRRWVQALIGMGLVEERLQFLALSDDGHRLMTGMIEALYQRQRELD